MKIKTTHFLKSFSNGLLFKKSLSTSSGVLVLAFGRFKDLKLSNFLMKSTTIAAMRIFLVLWTSLFLTSCAYHWGQHKRSIPGGYEKIAVPVFNNRTREAGLETDFTTALINEIERGGLAKVQDREDAQVVVEGRIENILYHAGTKVSQKDPGYTLLPEGVVLAKEYRINAKIVIDLRRQSDQKIIWSGEFTGERRYAAPQITVEVSNTSNALYNHSARRNVVRALAKDLMVEAYDRITENF
jgi:hypothetical protein